MNDTETSIFQHCKRVTKSDMDDWKNDKSHSMGEFHYKCCKDNWNNRLNNNLYLDIWGIYYTHCHDQLHQMSDVYGLWSPIL